MHNKKSNGNTRSENFRNTNYEYASMIMIIILYNNVKT